MLWAQGSVSLLLWIAYGAVLARKSPLARERLSNLGRGFRGCAGAGLLLLAVVILFAGLYGIGQMGGFVKDAMTPIGWLFVTFLGLFFVHLQSVATTYLISLVHQGVTPTPLTTSVDQTAQGSPQDE